MADGVRGGGPCLAALAPHMLRSRTLAPLRLLAAIHRMVLEVVRQTGLPLRLLEIGASAGLNLRWDHFPFLDVLNDRGSTGLNGYHACAPEAVVGWNDQPGLA